MSNITHLKVSLISLQDETARILQYLDSRVSQLMLNPAGLESDVEYANYVRLLDDIREYCNAFRHNEDFQLINAKVAEIPVITKADFHLSYWKWNIILLFVLLPLGLMVWLNTYVQIKKLEQILRETDAKTGTLLFMIKAMEN